MSTKLLQISLFKKVAHSSILSHISGSFIYFKFICYLYFYKNFKVISSLKVSCPGNGAHCQSLCSDLALQMLSFLHFSISPHPTLQYSSQNENNLFNFKTSIRAMTFSFRNIINLEWGKGGQEATKTFTKLSTNTIPSHHNK